MKTEDVIIAKTSKNCSSLYLPLDFHHKDTKGVIDYLLKHWVAESLYAELGIDRCECIRLCHFLAMIHDIGKATPVFQSRIIGNNTELRELLRRNELSISNSYMNKKYTSHPHVGANILRFFDCPEDIAVIVGAHHGNPESDNLDKDGACNEIKGYKENYGDDEWRGIQKAILDKALEESGFADASKLPQRLPDTSQMILTGLLIMADWIASNQEYFPLVDIDDSSKQYDEYRWEDAMEIIDLPNPCYISEYWKQRDFFTDRFGFKANTIQKQVKNAAAGMKKPGILIIEAPMGKGKTEAALAASEIFINRFDLGGLAFFLPSQATSNAMFERIKGWINNQPEADHISVQLAHGNAELNESFARFEEGYVQIDEDDNSSYKTITAHSFFRGRKTKLLANIVIGTVDQLLMASLRQRHIMLRHLGLMGKVVVIDECHAYDAYMNIYLDGTLKWLSAYHIPVILLSATLPGYRRRELLEAYAGKKNIKDDNIARNMSYPLISWYDDQIHMGEVEDISEGKRVEIIKGSESEALDYIGDALDAGGCVGIILNTVKRVQGVYDILKEKYPNADILVDHSQFIMGDRLCYEKLILDKVGKNSSNDVRRDIIVIGTQVLEQSLDLDFDLLITDLCPMDLLMQRLGREHRHNRIRPKALTTPRCIILGSDIDNLESGSKAIYGEYLLKKTSISLPKFINIPKDISALVHKVYDDEVVLIGIDSGDTADINNIDLKSAYEEYKNGIADGKQKAKGFLLREPCNDGWSSSIAGILDGEAEFDDVQASAQVRDGITSIEVIVVKGIDDNKAMIISGEDKGLCLDMDREPNNEETKIILSQRLRLPAYFSKMWNIDKVIKELEDYTAKMLAEWIRSPILKGELFLILDKDNMASLGGCELQYSKIKGLTYIKKEDEDE